jgi:hypothetical protein
MDSSTSHKLFGRRTRRESLCALKMTRLKSDLIGVPSIGDSGRLGSTPGSRRSSQSTLRSTHTSQASIPFPTNGMSTLRVHQSSQLSKSLLDPEPPKSFSSEGSISRQRWEEINALPQELLSQCLLTIQARERQTPGTRIQPPTTLPEVIEDETTLPRDPTVRSTLEPERERVRQMETLMVMWSRRCVFRSTAFFSDGSFVLTVGS